MLTKTRTQRASARPPQERRAAIVAAALPLILDRGVNVTTREIAEAAEIAEGTIFRVFPDKESLIAAVVDAALDTSNTETAIAAIERSLPFEQQLERAVEIMQQRMVEIWRLLSAIDGSGAIQGHRPGHMHDLAALGELFEPERRRLRIDPTRAARALRSLTFAGMHPALNADDPMTPAEIVSLLLDGIRGRTSRRATTAAKGSSC